MGLSVKTANLGKWFPPWTVTRTAWNAALNEAECVGNLYQRGAFFMAKLTDFTNWTCAEAWSVAKRGRDSVPAPVRRQVV